MQNILYTLTNDIKNYTINQILGDNKTIECHEF